MSTATLRVTGDRVAQVARAVAHADTLQVLVGYPEQTGPRSEGGITNPTLGYIHEHGSPAANIPARPHLVPGVEAAQDQLVPIFELAIGAALDGNIGAIERALHQIGAVAAGSVQHKIATGPFAPLQPETIRRKGSSRPLIDTGQLRQAVTYVVRPR